MHTDQMLYNYKKQVWKCAITENNRQTAKKGQSDKATIDYTDSCTPMPEGDGAKMEP